MYNNKQKSLGIDISDHSIEVALIIIKDNKPEILSLGRKTLEPGLVELGRVKDSKKLATALKEVLSSAVPEPILAESCVFGLPESIIYLHIFSLDLTRGKNLEEAVAKELAATIPIKKEDLLYSYKILNNNNPIKNKTKIIITAVDKRAHRGWEKFFKASGLKVSAYEVETIAVFRGMFNKYPDNPICLVDIGAVTTKVSIFTRQGLTYSYIIKSAGKNITYQLSQRLNISFKEAERLKIRQGLRSGENEADIVEIIDKILQKIFKEVTDSIGYFNKKYGYEPVKEIYLIGGSSKLAGLDEYIRTKDLGISVFIGQSLYKEKAGKEYIEAIGLGLRGLLTARGSREDIIVPAANMKDKKKKSADYIEIIRRKINRSINKRVLLLGFILIVIFFCLVYAIYIKNSLKEKVVIPARTATEESKKLRPNKEIIKEQTKEVKVKMIKIKNINSALNVRGGQGTDFKVVAKVNSGEEYIFIEEKEGWIKIKITDTEEGWVFKKFTTILEIQ